MKKILLAFLLTFYLGGLADATLTVTRVPVTKTGGSTPVLQNGSITDLGTSSGAGNVGIGSMAPGQLLDVTGTARVTGFTMSGHSPINGYVLTASDSNGDTTWSSAGGIGGWTVSGNDVYETNGGNVGIGSSIPTEKLSIANVTNGTTGVGIYQQSLSNTPNDFLGLYIQNGSPNAATYSDIAFGTRLFGQQSKIQSELLVGGAGELLFYTSNASSLINRVTAAAIRHGQHRLQDQIIGR